MAADVAVALREEASSGTGSRFALVWDASKAHRRIGIRREDWGWIACKPFEDGEVWLNRVGTYGISSASFWWTRFGSYVQRILSTYSTTEPSNGVSGSPMTSRTS